jgi:RimJ/RimL family protein N-acetyltransferase
MGEFRIETPRLILRSWREEDIDPFHAICSDPVVMETLGPLMSRDETAALIMRMNSIEAQHGHTAWAMERKADGALIGWCGLIPGAKGTPIEGKTDIGWRMASSVWGNGFATEAAIAVMTWAFDNLPDDAIWAITAVVNHRSRALMERLGMRHEAALDFDHPNVAADSPLLRHVSYRIDRKAWMQSRHSK